MVPKGRDLLSRRSPILQSTRPLCGSALALSLLLPWLNSEWIYTQDKIANVLACRGSSGLLSLYPLPNPTTPLWTQQNTNHPHTFSNHLVTADKQRKGRARSWGHRWHLQAPSLPGSRRLPNWQRAQGWGTSLAGTPQGDVYWKDLSV